jgi:hypothetical protein
MIICQICTAFCVTGWNASKCKSANLVGDIVIDIADKELTALVR